jgi:hypothetical protein
MLPYRHSCRRGEDDGRVLTRWWGVAAALWTLGYVLLYVAVVRSQDNDVAWWYVGLLWLASALAAFALSTRRPRALLGAAAVLYAVGVALGLLTIGVLLVPALVACLLGMRPAGRTTSA